MVFHWSLSNSKSPLVSSTLLSILIDLNNAVWLISTQPLISMSSSPCTNPLVTVPSAPITIGITVTFIFHNFFSSLARSRYLSLFSFSFGFTLWSTRTAKSTIRSFFFWGGRTIPRSGSSAQDYMIRLYLKISEKFVRLIFQDGFWVVQIPFYYYFTSSDVFTTTLTDGFSLESERQQVSSGLQDSSKYSGWSLQCFSLGCHDSSTDFQFFQSSL